MKEIILKISDFAVRLELDEEVMALPNNYRPFVAESAEDVGELLSMKVGLDAVRRADTSLRYTVTTAIWPLRWRAVSALSITKCV